MAMNPRLLVPRANFDADAANYLRAVESADGQALETPVKRAVDDFFRGVKADGTFSAIRSACLLCGARTLAGALVPLVGAAPTNNNFLPEDYNRETGLVGDGSTKYLDSNRANNADPQDDNHNAALLTVGGDGVVMASSSSLDGQNYLDIVDTPATRLFNRNNSGSAFELVAGTAAAGLYGTSRSESSGFDYRTPQGYGQKTAASETTDSRNVYIYARSDDGVAISAHSNARLAFYSIGESLDLALLDARVSALITAIGAAL